MTAWASATATNHPSFTSYSYMEDGPAYARDAAQLPTYLYFVNRPARSNVDDFNPFLKPFYYPGPTGNAPTEQTRVNWWFGGSSQLTFTNSFAMGWKAGKTGLMPIPQTQRDVNPNLSQNFGY